MLSCPRRDLHRDDVGETQKNNSARVSGRALMVRGHLPELWVSPRYSMRHPNEEFLPTERQGYLDHPFIRTARPAQARSCAGFSIISHGEGHP